LTLAPAPGSIAAVSKPRKASSAPSGGASASSPEGLEELGFEAALARLETIVDRLEQGDLELGQALAAFEEGEKWIARPFEETEETG
jgi:hypothetical protein